MYIEKPIATYMDDLSAHKPAPGGGSASALIAAAAGALCAMTANFTTGEKYKDNAGKVERILRDCKAITGHCLKMVEEDVVAYGAIDRAYAMPKGSDAEKEARTRVLQEALKGGTRVPMTLFGRCVELLRLLDELVNFCNPNLITDAGVAAYAAHAAMHGARLNAEINCKYIKDAPFVASVREDIATRSKAADEIASRIIEKVNARVSGRDKA
jgi:formiminotetrahydrofolate cyclodeaminase